MTDDEKNWRNDQEKHGWTLPKTHWILRLPVVCYARWFVLNLQARASAQKWGSLGIGMGVINEYDSWRLYAIYRGWA